MQQNDCPTNKPCWQVWSYQINQGAKGSKILWLWEEIHHKAFDDVKATIAKDVTLAYPDFSNGFEIYTDGSKRQLGAVITQNAKPIAFFSRRLSVCQQK